MTDEQILKLANHLKTLAQKLDKEGDNENWVNWVQGNLEGTAEVLELQVKEDKTN